VSAIGLEADCEDQGYSAIADGCMALGCGVWLPGSITRTGRPLRIVSRGTGQWWECPRCGASYGPVEQPL